MKINGYFNESCKICRTEINHYKKINNTINWVDVISDKNALFDTKLSKKDLIRRLHIIKNNPPCLASRAGVIKCILIDVNIFNYT